MSNRPTLFLGSSSKGLPVARVIEQLLSPDVDVELWSSAFEPGETTIEGLKRASDHADFAVLLLTADDTIVSPSARRKAPRDNVIFEAGLFTGGLGRDRCYLVSDENLGLKLPTDLLGVTMASYRTDGDVSLKAALRRSCDTIRSLVKRKRARDKVSQSEIAGMSAARRFCQGITGFWWCDREWDKGKSLGFARLWVDPRTGMPRVEGNAWDGDGESVATWWSIGSCVQPLDRELLFNFKGYHARSVKYRRKKDENYLGFSTYTFETSAGRPKSGKGEISDLNVDRGEVRETLRLKLRRCTSAADRRLMTSTGRHVERRALVRRQLRIGERG